MQGPLQFSKEQLLANFDGSEPLEDGEEAPVQKAPLAPPFKRPGLRKLPFATKNVLTLARARRREVQTELRRLKALENELAELDRLIAAAAKPTKRTAG